MKSAIFGGKITTLEKELRVEVETLFVPYGKDTVDRQFKMLKTDHGTRRSPEELTSMAFELMRDCAASGVNLTIENKPMHPPATGNYISKVTVRPTRKIVGKILAEFADMVKRLSN